MTCFEEYHYWVRRLIATAVATLGLAALPALFPSPAHAQINGVPASVTSPGFGGRAINGTPASVTSLGPHGFTPTFNPSTGVRFFANVPPQHFGGTGHHHHHHDSSFFPLVGGYPVPVAIPYPAESDAYADDDSDYQGGPTIFDRRGRGEESYVPPVKDAETFRHVQREEAAANNDPGPALPEPTPEPTVLVFKDGHELEIGNYAIVGQTLFDLTAGHSRKIAIPDLDLADTLKKNEDRGVSFQLPPGTQVN